MTYLKEKKENNSCKIDIHMFIAYSIASNIRKQFLLINFNASKNFLIEPQ